VLSDDVISATSDNCWLWVANDMGSSFTSTSVALALFFDVGLPPSGLYIRRNKNVVVKNFKPRNQND
jgi:hypothetical protein